MVNYFFVDFGFLGINLGGLSGFNFVGFFSGVVNEVNLGVVRNFGVLMNFVDLSFFGSNLVDFNVLKNLV